MGLLIARTRVAPGGGGNGRARAVRYRVEAISAEADLAHFSVATG